MINLWLATTEDYRDQILAGTLDATDEPIFATMQDMAGRQALYKADFFQGKTWYVFSLEIPEMQVDDVTSWMAANKGNQTKILGAWEIETGLQMGTEEDEGVITGIPVYPLNSRLLKFMPDIVTYDENGNETSRNDASVLTDVNLLQGQQPRNFD